MFIFKKISSVYLTNYIKVFNYLLYLIGFKFFCHLMLKKLCFVQAKLGIMNQIELELIISNPKNNKI